MVFPPLSFIPGRAGPPQSQSDRGLSTHSSAISNAGREQGGHHVYSNLVIGFSTFHQLLLINQNNSDINSLSSTE